MPLDPRHTAIGDVSAYRAQELADIRRRLTAIENGGQRPSLAYAPGPIDPRTGLPSSTPLVGAVASQLRGTGGAIAAPSTITPNCDGVLHWDSTAAILWISSSGAWRHSATFT